MNAQEVKHIVCSSHKDEAINRLEAFYGQVDRTAEGFKLRDGSSVIEYSIGSSEDCLICIS